MRNADLLACVADECMEQTAQRIAKATQESEPRALLAAQINIANLLAAEQDERLAAFYRSTDLLTADGVGVHVLRRGLKLKPLKNRQTGIDLMMLLLTAESFPGLRFFMLGGTPEVVERAAAIAQDALGSAIVGYHHGYFDESAYPEMCHLIRRSLANVVLVGMATPLKERWMAATVGSLPLVQLGVGGSLDVLAGHKRRAPDVMQQTGTEWIFRLLQEPRRLGLRYLRANVWLVRQIMRSRLHHRGRP